MKISELAIARGPQVESLVTALIQFQTQRNLMPSTVNVVRANSVTVITAEKVYVRVSALFMQTIVIDLSSSNEARLNIFTGGGPGIDLGALGHMHHSAIDFIQEFCHRNAWMLKKIEPAGDIR